MPIAYTLISDAQAMWVPVSLGFIQESFPLNSTICKEWSSTQLPSTALSTWAGNHFTGSGSTTVPMRFGFDFAIVWVPVNLGERGMHTVLCWRAGLKNKFTG